MVICTYAGNHSHGDALSAQRLGCSAMIVTPVTTSELEVMLSIVYTCLLFVLIKILGIEAMILYVYNS